MPKRWTLVAHPNFFRSLHAIPRGDVYGLSNAIWATLEETDDPTAGATALPEIPNLYEMSIYGYLVTYEVMEERGEIKLLLVQ